MMSALDLRHDFSPQRHRAAEREKIHRLQQIALALGLSDPEQPLN
jgi:hypothetical protein